MSFHPCKSPLFNQRAGLIKVSIEGQVSIFYKKVKCQSSLRVGLEIEDGLEALKLRGTMLI